MKLFFSAMLDYAGVVGNFMNIEFSQNNDSVMRNKFASNNMKTVGGSPLSSGPITHETVPLELQIEPDHYETKNESAFSYCNCITQFFYYSGHPLIL